MYSNELRKRKKNMKNIIIYCSTMDLIWRPKIMCQRKKCFKFLILQKHLTRGQTNS